MRYFRNSLTIFSWLVLAVATASLFACGSDPDAGGGINFTNYYPDIATDQCEYNSEYTYAWVESEKVNRRLDQPGDVRDKLKTQMTNFVQIPYTTGELQGYVYTTTLVSDLSVFTTSSIYKGGGSLKFLEYAFKPENEILLEKSTFSTDCSLTDHPNVWSFSTITDGQIRNTDTDYVNVYSTDLSQCTLLNNSASATILTRVEDVQLESGLVFNNAVIFYYLEPGITYKTLDMDLIDQDLGITLPTAADTNDLAVSYVEIYGVNTGLVAHGHFGVDNDTSKGKLHHFIELTDVANCN